MYVKIFSVFLCVSIMIPTVVFCCNTYNEYKYNVVDCKEPQLSKPVLRKNLSTKLETKLTLINYLRLKEHYLPFHFARNEFSRLAPQTPGHCTSA